MLSGGARRALALTLGACLGFSACSGAAGDGDGGPTVVVARVEGALDAGTLGLVKRAIDRCRAHDADRLVIDLDTPGGSVELMWKIAALLDERTPDGLETVAWVHDHALSAGVLLALSCDLVYMEPGASIGAALPVSMAPGGIVELPLEGGVRAKMLSALRAEFRAKAERRGVAGALAEAMVDPDLEVREVERNGQRAFVDQKGYADLQQSGEEFRVVRTVVARGELLSLSAEQAVASGFADGTVEGLDLLLEKIGRAGARVERLERSRSESLVAFLDMIAPLLLVAGLLLAFTELKAPGFGLPGILAVACFATLLVGRWLAGLADVPHLVAVVLGVVLIALELFVLPGMLWPGIVGAVLVVAGLILASIGPGIGFDSPLERTMLVDATFELFVTALLAVVGAWILSRFLPRAPILSRLVLDPARDGEASAMRGVPVFAGAPDMRPELARVGAVGVASTDLRPVGKVVLDADRSLEHEASASGVSIDRGARVRVVEVREGRLVVEAAASTVGTEP